MFDRRRSKLLPFVQGEAGWGGFEVLKGAHLQPLAPPWQGGEFLRRLVFALEQTRGMVEGA